VDYEKSKALIVQEARYHFEWRSSHKQLPGSEWDMEEITIRNVKGITTFEPLKEFTKLKRLEFGSSNSSLVIQDMEGLDTVPGIEELHFNSKTTIKKNIEVIARMDNLKSLGLKEVVHPVPSDLVASLKNLRFLSLSAKNYVSVKALPENLEELGLWFDALGSVPDYGVVEGLKTIHIGNISCKINNLDSLENFPNLESIRLYTAKVLTDISVVAQLSKLQVLHANHAGIKDLFALSGHKAIKQLHLRGTAVENIKEMGHCPELEILYLEKSKVKSIEGIREQFPKLRLLWIWHTKVKDLSPLTGMKQLENVEFSDMEPKSWDFLPTLTGLEVLDLYGSSFTDLSLLEPLSGLKRVRVVKSGATADSAQYPALAEKFPKTDSQGFISVEGYP
jgi:internalin A